MTDWSGRAAAAWTTLTDATRFPIPAWGARVHEPGRLRVVPAWPLSQVLHVAVLLQAAGAVAGPYTPEAVWRSFRRYRRGDGFLDYPWVGKRYYDDNAWIGLACAQRSLLTSGDDSRRWLARGEALLRFVSQGMRGGGVLWVEGGVNLHACSTGSAGVLAAAVGRVESGRPRAMALQCGEFIDRELVNPNGLIADSIAPERHVDRAEFTYNQGLAIQLRIERGLLDSAADLAERSDREFTGQRFWTHAAAFNAIYCRALLRLDAVRGEDRWRPVVEAYAQRCWLEGRDQRGMFSGAGRYDDGYVLDHAAVTGILAALALDRQQCMVLM